MAAKCNKFQANIFNKSKCQNCFRPKEQHSAEALECNKISRKISKCGYLFVAPEQYDFKCHLDRTRRWQRRFFVLYDDGELTFSVDENVSTIPQGTIDMNKCTDVYDAEPVTTHQYSVAVATNDKVVYFKGTTKEESSRWSDVLIMYPRSNNSVVKHRRTTSVSTSVITTDTTTQLASTPSSASTANSTNLAYQKSASAKSAALSRPRRHTSFHPTATNPTYSEGQLTHSITESLDTHTELIEDPSSSSLPPIIPPPSAMSSSRTVRGQRMRNKTVEVAKTYDSRSLSKALPGHMNGNTGVHQQQQTQVPSRPQYSAPQQPAASQPRSGPMTYRGVRSLKHKNQRSQEGLRKCNSLTDLSSAAKNHTPDTNASSDIDDYTSTPQDGMYRSRSRESLSQSFPRRHHSVGSQQRPALHDSVFQPPTSPSDSLSHSYGGSSHGGATSFGSSSPKTLFESLRDSLMNPPPPAEQLQNEEEGNRSRYLKYASIPQSHAIQDYEGHHDMHAHQESFLSNHLQDHEVNHRRTSSLDDLLSHPGGYEHDPTFLPPSTGRLTPTARTTNAPLHDNSSSTSYYPSIRSNRPHNRHSISALYPYGAPSGGSVLVTRTSQTISGRGNANPPSSVAPPQTQSSAAPPSHPSARGNQSNLSSGSVQDQGGNASGTSSGNATPGGTAETMDYKRVGKSRSPARSSPGRQPGDHLRVALNYLEDHHSQNETDESKMAKSGGDLSSLSSRLRNSQQQPPAPSTTASSPGSSTARENVRDSGRDSAQKPKSMMYMKKGWLLMLDSPSGSKSTTSTGHSTTQSGADDWTKHWFVLGDVAITFYKDSRAEETNQVDGSIDLTACFSVTESSVSRNYGFSIKSKYGNYTLSAMTSGIRQNWVQAISKCIDVNASHGDLVKTLSHKNVNGEVHQQSNYNNTRSTRRDNVDSSGGRGWDTRSHSPSPAGAVAGAVSDGRTSHSPSNRSHYTGVDSRGVYSSTSSNSLTGNRYSDSALSGHKSHSPSPSRSVSSTSSSPSKYTCSTWPYQRDDSNPDVDRGNRSRNNSVSSSTSSVTSAGQTPQQGRARTFVLTSSRKDSGGRVSSSTSPGGDRSRSPSAPRAPSAKVKSKSRSKSPRPRSPPLTTGSRMNTAGASGGNKQHDSWSLRKFNADLLTQHPPEDEGGGGKEIASSRRHPAARGAECEVSSVTSDVDSALVELLEAEVESLKAQLVHTQEEMNSIRHENVGLKSEIVTFRRDHKHSLDDMEKDQGRYMSQIEDIQEQMEITTQYLETKISAHENHAELTKIQVQTLKRQLGEARHTEQVLRRELRTLHSSLDDTTAELSAAQTQLAQTRENNTTAAHSSKTSSQKVSELELQINRLQQCLKDRDRDIANKDNSLQALRDDMDKKLNRYESMEKELSELAKVKQCLVDQSDSDSHTRQLLHQAERERDELQSRVVGLERQLDGAVQRENMAGSLNTDMADILSEKDQTIAELEEKLVENDARIHGLTEDIKLEIDENTSLQQNLEKACNDVMRLKDELQTTHIEIERLTEQVEELSVDLGTAQHDLANQEVVKGHLSEDIDSGVHRISVLEKDNKHLQMCVKKYQQQLLDQPRNRTEQTLQRQLEQLEKEKQSLEARCVSLDFDLDAVTSELSRVEEDASIQKEAYEQEMSDRYEQLLDTKQAFDSLQRKLNKMESLTGDQTSGSVSSGKNSKDAMKKLKQELKDSHNALDDMELAKIKQEKSVQSMEANYQNQLSLMSRRIEDLASKLSQSEKKNRKLEKKNARRNSKTLESDLPLSLTAGRGQDGDQSTNSDLADTGSEGYCAERVSELSTVPMGSVDSSSSSRESSREPGDGMAEPDTDKLEQIHELEHRLGYSQTMLDDCRHKISDLVLELGVFAGSAKDPTHAETLDHVRDRLNVALEHCETHEPDALTLSTTVSSDLRTCAEKLSVEAVVLGEMAKLCRKESLMENPVLCDGERHLVCMQQASQCITRIQHKLTHKDKSISDSTAIEQSCDGNVSRDSLKQYSSVLTNKLILQAQMSVLLTELSRRQQKQNDNTSDDLDDDDNDALSKLDQEVEHFLAKECLLISHTYRDVSQDLLTNGTSTNLATSLAPRALVSGELDFIWNKLKREMRDCNNDDDRVCLMEQQLRDAHERLMERKHSLMESISGYRDKECVHIFQALVTEKCVEKVPVVLCMNTDATEDFTGVVLDTEDMDEIDVAVRRVAFLVEFLAGRYALELYGISLKGDSDSDDQVSLLQAAINDEIKTTTTVLECAQNKTTDFTKSEALVDHLVHYLEIVAQKAVINARVAHISNVLRDNVPMPADHTTGSLSTLSKGGLASQLEAESKVRKSLAEHLWLPSGCGDAEDNRIKTRLAYIASKTWSLNQQLERFESQSWAHLPQVTRDVTKEALFQAQLVMVGKCLEAKHQREMKDLRYEMKELNRSDNPLHTSNVDDAYVSELEQEIDELKRKIAKNENDDSGSSKQDLETEMHILRQTHTDEIDMLKRSQDRHIQERTSAHRKEIVNLKQQHQHQLHELTASDNAELAQRVGLDEDSESHRESLLDIEERLQDDKNRYVDQLESMRETLQTTRALNVGTKERLSDSINELETQIQELQSDYEQEILLMKSTHRKDLTRNRDEMFEMLANAESKSLQLDENVIRQKYTKEIEKIKEMYDKGFSSMEKSHQKVLIQLRQTQKREIEKLGLEKDVLLQEETKATQSALDAMKKAHESELKRERNKFLDMISKTYSQNDVRSLQKQHEEDLELIQQEMRQLTEQFSIKCMENATQEEQLDVQTRALQDSRGKVQQLMARNDELNMRLRQDIEKLNRLVMHRGSPLNLMRRDSSEIATTTDLKIAARIKEAELNMMSDERDNYKQQLHSVTEELEEHMSKYEDLHKDYEKIRSRYEKEIESLKTRLQEAVAATQETENDVTSQSSSSESAPSLPRTDPPNMTKPPVLSTNHQPVSIMSTRKKPPPPRRASTALASTGRTLPPVPTDLRNHKKNMWRQRQPQRALSVPSIPAPLSFLSADEDDSEITDATMMKGEGRSDARPSTTLALQSPDSD